MTLSYLSHVYFCTTQVRRDWRRERRPDAARAPCPDRGPGAAAPAAGAGRLRGPWRRSRVGAAQGREAGGGRRRGGRAKGAEEEGEQGRVKKGGWPF